MLPEVFFIDECDPIHETKFFSILHQNEGLVDYPFEESSDTVPNLPKSCETVQIAVSRNKRVIGKNYSYPLKFDPLYGEMYD